MQEKKKEFWDAMLRGTAVEISGSCYINSEHITLWRQHFHVYRFSGPVIPLSDGHGSQVTNGEVMSFLDANNMNFYA
jgi:hypothetical protein